MDRERIEQQLTIDEGKHLAVYLDSLQKPTVGIGHLVLESDDLSMGDSITEERCDQLFQHDLDKATTGAVALFPDLAQLPEALKESIVNMVFNMGVGGLGKFHHFIAAVNAGDYNEAANQLVASTWYKQVGKRAVRIVAAVRGCAGTRASK